MDYQKTKTILKNGFLIDLNNEKMMENEELQKNNYEKLIEVLLWKTIWQCNEYFIPEDFFGTKEHPNENLERIQLVMSVEKNFNYIIRRIIIENIAMDTFLSLGKKIHSEDRIKDGMKYVSMFSDNGYYEMIASGKLDENKKIKKEVIEKRKKELYDGDPILEIDEKYNEAIKRSNRKYNLFLNNNYIRKCKNQGVFFKEYFDSIKERKGKQTIEIPAFECKQFATMLKENKLLKRTDEIFNEEDIQKKLRKINEHRTLIEKLEFSQQKEQQTTIEQTISRIEKKKNLDNNIHSYYLEKYLHGKLQYEIINLCKELRKKYGLESSSLQNSLIDTINMNLQFGMNYVLRYPIQYIHNHYIKFDNNSWNSDSQKFYVNENEAEKIWINKYHEYLATLSYVTIPLVRTVFEANLYDCCEKIITKEDISIEDKMFHLLESYELDNSECIHFDFNSKNIESDLSSITFLSNRTKYIIDAINLKKTVKFKNENRRKFKKLKNTYSLSSKLVLQFYPIWFDPKNFQQFYNKVIDENYYEISNDKDMEYYKKKICEARRNSIIVKYSQKWKK